MKQIKKLYAIIMLLFLSLGFSSCYLGYYEPGPRYRTGPRYYRPVRPHYHPPARHYHHHHHNGHGRGRW